MLGPHGLRQLATAAALLGCGLPVAGCGEQPEQARGAAGTGVVEHVVDGDTLRLEGVGRVRLIGIDTPELHPAVEPCGRAATAFVEHLLAPGTRVRYRPGPDPRDRYGRLLADVRLPDGRLLQRLLLARGYARPLAITPNVERAGGFERLADRARARGRGIWSRAGCPSG